MTDNQDDYKYDAKDYYYLRTPVVFEVPRNPVGYWILDPHGQFNTKIAMYSKPTEAYIKYTEEMLGWKWEDFTSAE